MRVLIFIWIVILIFPLKGYSQENKTVLANITVDSWENPKFNDVKVLAYDLFGQQRDSTVTVMGKCTMLLNLNTTYRLDFIHPDFYTKTIEVMTEIPKKEQEKTQSLQIEILLKKNCENSVSFALIMDEPMGRIAYEKSLKAFQYDFDYTYKMESKYENLRKERCTLAEAKRKEDKRLAEEALKKQKEAEKLALEKAESDRLNSLKASQDSLIAAQKLAEEQRLAQIEQKRLERAEEERKFKEEEELRKKQTLQKEADEKQLALEAVEAKKKEPKFDESKIYIYIFPRHGWPSELANYVQNPAYDADAIGTFSYSLTEGRKDIYIEDAEELRVKFPKEFEKAFPNWNYIVEINKQTKTEPEKTNPD